MMALNFICLCFLSAGVRSEHHCHAWFKSLFAMYLSMQTGLSQGLTRASEVTYHLAHTLRTSFLEALRSVSFFFMNLWFVFWSFKSYYSVNGDSLDAKRALFTVVAWVVYMVYHSLSTNPHPKKCLNLRSVIHLFPSHPWIQVLGQPWLPPIVCDDDPESINYLYYK